MYVNAMNSKNNSTAFKLCTFVSYLLKINMQKFKALIENELRRKEQFNEWQQSYAEKNEHLTEPKELIREESRRTLELSVSQQTERDLDHRQRTDKKLAKDEKRCSSVRSNYARFFVLETLDLTNIYVNYCSKFRHLFAQRKNKLEVLNSFHSKC